MSPRPRLVPLALAAAAAVLLGGCSGGSTATAGATAPAAATTAQLATSSAADAAGSKVFAEPTECGSIAQKYGSVSSAMMPVLQGRSGPTPFDAEALVAAVDAETMGTIPAAVAPDFAAFKAAGQQLRDKDLTAAAALLDGPQMSKAAADIEKFLSDHC